jgi:hypothetical protein
MAEQGTKVEEASSVAIEKTREAQEAVEDARRIQAEASEAKHLELMVKALKVVFPEAAHMPDDEMRIFLPRVPLICKSILTIEDSLKKISDGMVDKAEFKLIRAVVFGFVSLVLVGFVGVLIASTFK